ncbi:hypothetical protein BHM03_00014674 [Ensete ventricosum]|uniref:Uncharacterized protein n=1 Tax=Ensete ventricosum TaxID=4639 RepID=A0A445MEA3_ENSVE|nr:hypothetical protein BHM03_00014674 [Ensete ventricosum]
MAIVSAAVKEGSSDVSNECAGDGIDRGRKHCRWREQWKKMAIGKEADDAIRCYGYDGGIGQRKIAMVASTEEGNSDGGYSCVC